MRVLICFILLLVSNLQSAAQQLQFVKYKDWGYDDIYGSSFFNPSDSTAVVAYSSMKNGIRWLYSNTYADLYQSGLMILDMNGDSLRIIPDYTKYGAIVNTVKNSSGYVSVFLELPQSRIHDFVNRLNIYDALFNLRHSPILGAEYPPSGYFGLTDVYANDSDTKIYALGTVQDTTSDGDVVLYKMNDDGTEVWKRQYRIPGSQWCLHVRGDARSNKLLISGISRGGAAYVLGVDTSGALLYSRELYVPSSRAEWVNIKRTPDGGYAGILTGDSSFFFKYDSQFQPVYLEKFYLGVYQSLNVFDDGSVALQCTKDAGSVDSLIKFNPDNGQRIWGAVTYEPGFAQNDARGFSYFPNGDVLITGYKPNFNGEPGDFYWAKISNFGHPFDPVTATTRGVPQKPAWLGLLPNPAREVVSISCSAPPRRSYIYSSTGRLVQRFTGFKANISSLPAGIYLIQAELQNGQRATAKLVKE